MSEPMRVSSSSSHHELQSVVSNTEVTPLKISNDLRIQSKKLANLTSKEINGRIIELNNSVAAEKEVGWWSRGTDKKIALKAQISDLKKTQKEILKLKEKLDASKEGEAGIKEVESVSKKIEEKALSFFLKPLKSNEPKAHTMMASERGNFPRPILADIRDTPPTSTTPPPPRISNEVLEAIKKVDQSESELVQIYKTQINKVKEISISTNSLLNSQQTYKIENESNKFKDEIAPLKNQCNLLLNEITKMGKIPDLEIGNKNPLEFCTTLKLKLDEINKKFYAAVRKSQLERGIKDLQKKITSSALPSKLENEWKSRLKSINAKDPEALANLDDLQDNFDKLIEKRADDAFVETVSRNPGAYISKAINNVERLKQIFDNGDNSSLQFQKHEELEANRRIILNFKSSPENLNSEESVKSFAIAFLNVNRLERDFSAFNSVKREVQKIDRVLTQLDVFGNDQLELTLLITESSVDLPSLLKNFGEDQEEMNFLITKAKKASEFNQIMPLCNQVLKEAEEINRILDAQSKLHVLLEDTEKNLESSGYPPTAIKSFMESLSNRAILVIEAAKLGTDEYDSALEKFKKERNEGWILIEPSNSEPLYEFEPSVDEQLKGTQKNSLEPVTKPSPNWSDVAKEARSQRDNLKSKTESERRPSVTESEYDVSDDEYEWAEEEEQSLHRTNSLSSRERSSSEIDHSLDLDLLPELKLRKSPPNLSISECIQLATSTQDLLNSKLNMNLHAIQQLENEISPLKERCAVLLGEIKQMENVQNLEIRNQNLLKLGDKEKELIQIQTKYAQVNLRQKISSSFLDQEKKDELLLKLKIIKSINDVAFIGKEFESSLTEYSERLDMEYASKYPKTYFSEAQDKVRSFIEITKKSPFKIFNAYEFQLNIGVIEDFISENQTSSPSVTAESISQRETDESIKFAKALLFFKRSEKDISAFKEINKNVKKIKDKLNFINNSQESVDLKDQIDKLSKRYEEIVNLMNNPSTPDYIQTAQLCQNLLKEAKEIKKKLEPQDVKHAQEAIPNPLDKGEDERAQGNSIAPESIPLKPLEHPDLQRERSPTLVDKAQLPNNLKKETEPKERLDPDEWDEQWP